MKQYLDLLRNIIDNGVKKEPARAGMPPTFELNSQMMKFDLSEGFPLMTTKKMAIKSVMAELMWFLRGQTNIAYLHKDGCHIWDADAYKYYKRLCAGAESISALIKDENDQFREVPHVPIDSFEGFREHARLGEMMLIFTPDIREMNTPYILGDCGRIYSMQWNKWGLPHYEKGSGHCFNQINHLVEELKNKPDSRYHIVSAWNPTDFLDAPTNAALPACHMMFQCFVRNGYLDLLMFQRSCDMFLGVPFNIASYAMLDHLIANEVGLKAGVFTWVGGSCHIYENHIDAVAEQLSREPKQLPTLKSVNSLYDAIENGIKYEIINYEPHPTIKAELSVGV